MHGCLSVLLLRLASTCTMQSSHTTKGSGEFSSPHASLRCLVLPWPLACPFTCVYTVGHRCQRCTGDSCLRGTKVHEVASPGEVITTYTCTCVYAHVHIFLCMNPTALWSSRERGYDIQGPFV